MKKTMLFLVANILVNFSASADSSAIALVYKGTGSCEEVTDQGEAGNYTGCSEAAAQVAAGAGFKIRYVGPGALSQESSQSAVDALFRDVKVWVQPGGKSVNAYQAMSPRLRAELKKFISSGGGYVGFCAGAFMATAMIGNSGKSGLGIISGSTQVFPYVRPRPDLNNAFLNSYWNGKPRSIYFEGGPYLYGQGSEVEVTARFETGATLSAKSKFGKGRVYLSGGHPEAPLDWSVPDLRDPDDLDQDLAAEMMLWAAQLK